VNEPQLAVFDLDGTLYRGAEAVPHAPEVVSELHRRGILVRYFTNNSAAQPDATTAKLVDLGFPCEPSWVYGTGPAAAQNVKRQGLPNAYVVGEDALLDTFRAAGVQTITAEEAVQGVAAAVVVGICRSFTYTMLRTAQRAIVQGAVFIATNRDATYPVEGGLEDPGAGSIVAAVATASGQEPLVIGKPSPLLVDQIITDAGVSASETLVVGDRIDTDIAAGVAAGCRTFLVLTGVTRELPAGQEGGADLRSLL